MNKTLHAIRRRLANLNDDPPENEQQYKAAFRQAIDDIQALLLYAETHEFLLIQTLQNRCVKVQIREEEAGKGRFEVIVFSVESGQPLTRGIADTKLEEAIAHARQG